MRDHRNRLACRQFLKVFLFIVVSLTAISSTAQTQAPVINRDRGREMLRNIKDALKEGYYDPQFRGLNVDARFKDAEKEINQATSTWQINTIIALVLLELNDSHTRFIPPDLAVGVSFSFQMHMIGDSCYVIRVEPGSDAEKKGLKVGDLIYSIEGFEPTRATLWKIVYSYFLLLPPPSLRVAVQHPKGHITEILISAAVSEKQRRKIRLSGHTQNPPKYYALSNDVMLCKLPAFELNDEEVDQMMKNIRAQATTLILDLRGNRGGRVATEKRLLGYFFEKDIKIGDLKRRTKIEERVAKSRGPDKTFKGKLFVLVDSNSASAAEVFARVIQLEKRGVVLGDVTKGAVMTSVLASFAFKTPFAMANPSSFYGANITIGDLIMVDGKSLENIGVTPDERLLPRGEDLAAKRDPVLAHAAELAGVVLDPAKAGTILQADAARKEDDKSDQEEPPLEIWFMN